MGKTLDLSKVEQLTEDDHLQLLKGKDGDRGPEGKDGIGTRGDDGDDGIKGDDGDHAPKITDIKIEKKHLVITLESGESYNAGRVVGQDGEDAERAEDGKDGEDGLGIANIEVSQAGELIVTFTDANEKNLGNVIGPKGDDGDRGKNGKPGDPGIQGKSILGGSINKKGNLILTFSDSSMIDVGRVRGLNGEKGKDGRNGGAVSIEAARGAGENLKIVTKDEDYLVNRGDRTVIMDTESGTPGIRTITVPSALGIRGTHFNLVSKYGNKFRVIIVAEDGGLINGCASIDLLFAEEMINIQSDGFEWFMVK